jgi:hypothetical protein
VASPKRCGKCQKRPYCSRECQLHDWKLGHKHWCSISGENGYDFEVREVLGKGRGIFAKKCFERGDVVMMERPLPHGRNSKVEEFASSESVLKAVMALMPHGGSLRAIFDLNSMGCNDESGVGESGLFVTMAYLNHACLANTLHHFVDSHGVKILSASRRIEQGEEITISYINQETEEFLNGACASNRSELLRKKWGFVCDCLACSNPASIGEKFNRMLELDTTIMECGRTMKYDLGIRAAKALLRIYDDLGEHPKNYSRTYYDLFQLSIMRRSTLGLASGYLRLAIDERKLFLRNVPDETLQRFERYMKSPASHMAYLSAER